MFYFNVFLHQIVLYSFEIFKTVLESNWQIQGPSGTKENNSGKENYDSVAASSSCVMFQEDHIADYKV